MARKSKEVKKELLEVTSRLEEIKRIQELAETEEKELLESTIEKIKGICDANNLFCGVILTTKDLLAIIQIAIETKENVNVPFMVYFND